MTVSPAAISFVVLTDLLFAKLNAGRAKPWHRKIKHVPDSSLDLPRASHRVTSSVPIKSNNL